MCQNFGSALDKRTVVHIWKEKEILQDVVAAGYHALLSNYQAWYLDWVDTTWETVYANEPLEGITDPAQQALVLGGQVRVYHKRQ
jgi:hexosaminidase